MPGASMSAKEYLAQQEAERAKPANPEDREMERLRTKGVALGERAQRSGNRHGEIAVDDTTLTLRGQLAESDFREGRVHMSAKEVQQDERSIEDLKRDLMEHGDGWGRVGRNPSTFLSGGWQSCWHPPTTSPKANRQRLLASLLVGNTAMEERRLGEAKVARECAHTGHSPRGGIAPAASSRNTGILYYGDNLDILRGDYIPDESVDLIYLDPPFNSNRDYNVIFKDESGA